MNNELEIDADSPALLLSIEAAASRLSCSPWSIRAWIRSGAIRSIKLGRRRMVPAEEVTRVASAGLPSISFRSAA